MPSLTTLVHQARHGHAEAIATLLNRHLNPHGITSQVVLREDCLKILLESTQPLTRRSLFISFIQNGLRRLNLESVHQVRVYARLVGQTAPLWVESFGLHTAEAAPPLKQPVVKVHYKK